MGESQKAIAYHSPNLSSYTQKEEKERCASGIFFAGIFCELFVHSLGKFSYHILCSRLFGRMKRWAHLLDPLPQERDVEDDLGDHTNASSFTPNGLLPLFSPSSHDNDV